MQLRYLKNIQEVQDGAAKITAMAWSNNNMKLAVCTADRYINCTKDRYINCTTDRYINCNTDRYINCTTDRYINCTPDRYRNCTTYIGTKTVLQTVT